MRKVSAIARYELLMAWRRRSLPIVWILLLAGVVGFALLVENVNYEHPIVEAGLRQTAASDAPSWEQGIDLLEATHTIALINVMIAGMIFYTVGVTLIMGEIIPLDRQFKVSELFETLPLSRAAYLGGKLLGAWAGLLSGTLMVGVICALLLRLIFGAYDLRVFAALWLLMLLPASFLAAALSILLASAVKSRRAAVLIGLAIMPFDLILMALAVTSFAGVGALIKPIYAIGILLQPGDASNAEIVSRIINTLAIYALTLLVVWTLVWAWARLREAR